MNRFFYTVLLACSVNVFAYADAVIIDASPQALIRMMEDTTEILAATADQIPRPQKRRVAQQLERVIDRLERIADELARDGGQTFGNWFQANNQECVSFCRAQGMTNAFSPEGALCVSGEAQARSAVGKIAYSYGTWGGGPQPALASQSSGGYCYTPGQKRDNDRTDRTVGCFCRR